MISEPPRVDRTAFTPVPPPGTITLYFCPACGVQIRGAYNLEPARKRCTKTWHLDHPVPRRYVGESDSGSVECGASAVAP